MHQNGSNMVKLTHAMRCTDPIAKPHLQVRNKASLPEIEAMPALGALEKTDFNGSNSGCQEKVHISLYVIYVYICYVYNEYHVYKI